MKNSMIRFFYANLFIPMGLALSLPVMAVNIASSVVPANNPDNLLTPLATLQSIEAQYCPAPETLFNNNMIWGAPNGWRSNEQSFIKKIGKFTGAHWIGVKVGRVICTYQGVNAMEFGLTLEKTQYVLTPGGAKWGKEINGIINCDQKFINDPPLKVTDCPFYIANESFGPTDLKSLEELKRPAGGGDIE